MNAVQTGRHKRCAHLDAAQGRAIGPGREVALHDRLIGCVLLQVIEEAVERHGPESWAREVEVEAAEAGLVIGGDQMKHGAGLRVRRKQQEHKGDDDSGPQQETLHDIGPNYGAQAADERVEDGDDAEADDEQRNGPAGKARDCEGEQIEDEAHLGKMAGGEGEGRIHAHSRSEAFAEVFVYRHRDRVAKKGNDDGSEGQDNGDEEKVGNQQMTNRPRRQRPGRR